MNKCEKMKNIALEAIAENNKKKEKDIKVAYEELLKNIEYYARKGESEINFGFSGTEKYTRCEVIRKLREEGFSVYDLPEDPIVRVSWLGPEEKGYRVKEHKINASYFLDADPRLCITFAGSSSAEDLVKEEK